MAKKSDDRKLRSMSIEKVKTGDGKPMFKVRHEYHPTKGKEGKGFGASLGGYHDPDDIYHSTAGKAKKHFNANFHRITADPNEKVGSPVGLSGSADQPNEDAGESVEE